MTDLHDRHRSEAAAGDSSEPARDASAPLLPSPGLAADRGPSPSLLAAAIDELDYGILLVASGARVLHANHTASIDLDDDHPLQLHDGQLGVKHAKDKAPLHDALDAAVSRGLRTLLSIGVSSDRLGISIVPLGPLLPAPGTMPALLVLGRRRMCEHLSVQGYAKTYGLTAAEARVLAALCGGARPDEVAARLDIAISTVRTQIGSIRDKTGVRSITALLQEVALLPPIRGSLRGIRSRGDLAARPGSLLAQASWH